MKETKRILTNLTEPSVPLTSNSTSLPNESVQGIEENTLQAFKSVLPEVLILTLLAAAFRFFMLGHSDLWKDEVAIYFDALNGTHEYVSPSHLFHLKLVGWLLNHVAPTPWVLRCWGAFAGTLVIPVLYAIGYMTQGKQLARITGILACLSPFMLFYSRDGNYYGAMTLFASLQLLALALYLYRQRVLSLVLILVTALASHYNHPFASVQSVFALGTFGLLVVVEFALLFRKRGNSWSAKNVAAAVAIGALGLFGIAMIASRFQGMVKSLKDRLTIGESLTNAEPGLKFFSELNASMLGSYLRPLEWDLAIKLVSCFPLVLLIIGSIKALLGVVSAVRGKEFSLFANRQQLTIGLVLLIAFASLASSLLVIFNISGRTFNVRYFAFMAPGFFVLIAYGIWFLATQVFRKPVAVYGLTVPLLIFYLLLNSLYYLPQTSNYRTMTEQLLETTDEETIILLPTTEEFSQARYYFTPELLQRTDLIQIRTENDFSASSWLPLYLYGKENVVLSSAWRHWPLLNFWPLVHATFRQDFKGFSIHGYNQNAVLYNWDVGTKALLTNAATRFELAKGENTIVLFPGRWQLHGSQELINEITTPLALEAGNFLTSKETHRLTFTLTQGGTLTALPQLSDRLNIGPYGHYNFTNDTRNKEAVVENGAVVIPAVPPQTLPENPVYKMSFDGTFNYLLFQPENAPRHLVLKRFCPATPPDKAHTQSPFVYEVAVDGVHVGLFVSEDKPGQFVRTEVDLNLAPGNHEVAVYATRLRGGDPFHNWAWGGAEWNAEKAKTPAIPLPAAVYSPVGNAPPEPWGAPGEEELAKGIVATEVVYNRTVSLNERGPSGLAPLVFSFNGEYTNPATAYTTTYGKPFPVKEGQLFAYVTYLKNDRAKNYATSLMTAFVDTQGNVRAAGQGKQQHATFPLTMGWARYVEIGVAPKGCVAVVPGVFVYPPNPAKIAQQGRILADCFAPLSTTNGPFSPGYLSPELFFPLPEVAP